MRSFIPFLLLFGLSISIIGCQNSNKKDQQTLVLPDIPTLLDRNKALQNGKEWETVQSLYGQYRNQLMKDPKAVEPLIKLTELFINEARITGEHGHYYQGALKMINRVLEHPLEGRDKDQTFRALSDKASVQLSLHDFNGALETGTGAIAINPYNAAIYGVMVDANVELGHYEKAVEMADKMVSIRPDLRSYSRVSYLREIYGQPKGAIEAMEMAVAAGFPGQEQTCWTRMTLGHLEESYGSLEKASYQYQVILEERPDYPFAIAALGRLEMNKGHFDEAEKLLKKACSIIPEVSFYEQLAELYKKTNRMADHDNTVKEVLAMMADDVVNGHNMDLEYARFYSDQVGDYDKALEYAQKEYDRRPDNIDVNRVMTMIYERKGDKSNARLHLEKATRTNSQHPDLQELKSGLATL